MIFYLFKKFFFPFSVSDGSLSPLKRRPESEGGGTEIGEVTEYLLSQCALQILIDPKVANSQGYSTQGERCLLCHCTTGSQHIINADTLSHYISQVLHSFKQIWRQYQ